MRTALILLLRFCLWTSSAWGVEVTLQWDPNTEPDLAGYVIYYAEGHRGPPFDGIGSDKGPSPIFTSMSGATGHQIDNSDPVTFVMNLPGDKGVVDYCFAVTAYDTEGRESGFSNQVCLSGDTTYPSPDEGAPPTPQLRIKQAEGP